MQPASVRKQLYEAIESNDSAGVERALRAGADAAGADGYTPSPLVSAVRYASTMICHLLIEGGALLGNRQDAGVAETGPLHEAARTNAVHHCRFLIDSGADVNDRDITGKTALHVAAINGDELICRDLIEAGADVHLIDDSGMTALHYAVRFRSPSDGLWVAKALTAGGANPAAPPSTPSTEYLTPFQQAVEKGRLMIVKHFIDECGADPSQTTAAGETMLDLARSEVMVSFLRARIMTNTISTSMCGGIGDRTADGHPNTLRSPSFGPL